MLVISLPESWEFKEACLGYTESEDNFDYLVCSLCQQILNAYQIYVSNLDVTFNTIFDAKQVFRIYHVLEKWGPY